LFRAPDFDHVVGLERMSELPVEGHEDPSLAPFTIG
jgi:hypothetical protein